MRQYYIDPYRCQEKLYTRNNQLNNHEQTGNEKKRIEIRRLSLLHITPDRYDRVVRPRFILLKSWPRPFFCKFAQ